MTAIEPDREESFEEYTLRSDLREFQGPKSVVLEKLAENGYCEDAVFAIKLALEEAFSNAVKHGNQSDPDKQIRFRFSIDQDRAVFVVRDEGEGFEPEEIPDCTSPERLPLPNGRGIKLICAYMDKVEYRDNGRELYLMKRRSTPSPTTNA